MSQSVSINKHNYACALPFNPSFSAETFKQLWQGVKGCTPGTFSVMLTPGADGLKGSAHPDVESPRQ